MNRPSYLLFKKCSTCGEILYISRFNKAKGGKYGVRGDCKECQRKQTKKWREEHKEEVSEYNKNYREEHREDRKEYNKKYKKENKEEVSEYNKNYRKEHRDYYNEYNKNYRKEHREDRKEYNKNYREEHRDYYNEYNKNYKINNPQNTFNNSVKRRKKESIQGNGISKEQWYEMMEFFNWSCAYSGEYIGGKSNNKRTVDHIVPLNNNGEHEIWNCIPMIKSYNSSKSTKNMLEWYIQQDYFDIDRLTKIYEWRIYAYWKWKE